MMTEVNTDQREAGFEGPGEVFAVIGHYRIARTAKNTQWALQRLRSGVRGGQAKWDAVGYCRKAQTLARMCLTHLGAIPVEVLSLLDPTEGAQGDA